MNYSQYQLAPVNGDSAPQMSGVENSPNVLKTAKRILTRDSVEGRYMVGGYLVRGANSTGYSTVTVFDPGLGGFCQVRTHIDVGNSTITATNFGHKGQELYLKIDNDTDANRTITFGWPYKVTGTLTGSTAATAILHFISDGSYFWEVSRTTGLNQ